MSDKPIECRALAVIREAGGLKKGDMAARLDMEPGKYYDFETDRIPPRHLLEQAAAAVDLPPHHVDRTLDYLRRTDAEAAAYPAGDPGAAADLEIDRLETALGRLHGDVLRRSRRLARAVADREIARVHFPRLRAYPAAERPAVVRENPAFQTWAVSELAAHESIDAAAGEPDEALAWADLAVLIAELASGDPAFHPRSLGYALFHRGNAFRVKGRLHPEAAADVDRAKGLWKAGEAGDPDRLLDEARVLGLEASLRREQRRFSEALDLLDCALAGARGDEKKYLLINRANTLEDQGDFTQALATLRQVLPLLYKDREPGLYLVARYNELVVLCHLGHFAIAAGELDGVRNLAVELGSGMRLARLGWLSGWIKAGLGQPTEAEAAFERVRRELLRRDIPFDTALVSLELAVLYQEQGRTAEVRQLAGELAPVFVSQRISREALATVLLFRDAVEQETLTLDLAQSLRDDLRRNLRLAEPWC
jgi:tetratricopeptide (TPR) repeat protein